MKRISLFLFALAALGETSIYLPSGGGKMIYSCSDTGSPTRARCITAKDDGVPAAHGLSEDQIVFITGTMIGTYNAQMAGSSALNGIKKAKNVSATEFDVYDTSDQPVALGGTWRSWWTERTQRGNSVYPSKSFKTRPVVSPTTLRSLVDWPRYPLDGPNGKITNLLMSNANAGNKVFTESKAAADSALAGGYQIVNGVYPAFMTTMGVMNYEGFLGLAQLWKMTGDTKYLDPVKYWLLRWDKVYYPHCDVRDVACGDNQDFQSYYQAWGALAYSIVRDQFTTQERQQIADIFLNDLDGPGGNGLRTGGICTLPVITQGVGNIASWTSSSGSLNMVGIGTAFSTEADSAKKPAVGDEIYMQSRQGYSAWSYSGCTGGSPFCGPKVVGSYSAGETSITITNLRDGAYMIFNGDTLVFNHGGGTGMVKYTITGGTDGAPPNQYFSVSNGQATITITPGLAAAITDTQQFQPIRDRVVDATAGTASLYYSACHPSEAAGTPPCNTVFVGRVESITDDTHMRVRYQRYFGLNTSLSSWSVHKFVPGECGGMWNNHMYGIGAGFGKYWGTNPISGVAGVSELYQNYHSATSGTQYTKPYGATNFDNKQGTKLWSQYVIGLAFAGDDLRADYWLQAAELVYQDHWNVLEKRWSEGIKLVYGNYFWGRVYPEPFTIAAANLSNLGIPIDYSWPLDMLKYFVYAWTPREAKAFDMSSWAHSFDWSWMANVMRTAKIYETTDIAKQAMYLMRNSKWYSTNVNYGWTLGSNALSAYDPNMATLKPNASNAPTEVVFNRVDDPATPGAETWTGNDWLFSRTGWNLATNSPDSILVVRAGGAPGGAGENAGTLDTSAPYAITKGGRHLISDDCCGATYGVSEPSVSGWNSYLDTNASASSSFYLGPEGTAPYNAWVPATAIYGLATSEWAGANGTGSWRMKKIRRSKIQAGSALYAMVDLQRMYSFPTVTANINYINRHFAHFKKAGTAEYVIVADNASVISGVGMRSHAHYPNNGYSNKYALNQYPEGSITEGATAWSGAGNLVVSRAAVGTYEVPASILTMIVPAGGTTIKAGPENPDGTYTSPRPGAYPGTTFRVTVCPSTDAGATCNESATEGHWFWVHKIASNLTDSSLTAKEITTASNFLGVQVDDAAGPKVLVIPKDNALRTSVTFTTTHGGVAQYLVTGLAAGKYNIAGPTPSACAIDPIDSASGNQENAGCYWEGLGGGYTISEADTALGPTIEPGWLPNGRVGTPYSQTLSASGGSGQNYTFHVSDGVPPAGVTLNGPTLEGVPTTASIFDFSITVSDADAGPTTRLFTITVQQPGAGTMTEALASAEPDSRFEVSSVLIEWGPSTPPVENSATLTCVDGVCSGSLTGEAGPTNFRLTYKRSDNSVLAQSGVFVLTL